MVDGNAIIYFSDMWKINDEDDTRGWYYSFPGFSESQPPQGSWTTQGYGGGDIDPPPTVMCQTSTTITTSVNPNELMDVTDAFAPDFTIVKLSDDITYRCCCQRNEDESDVTCVLADDAGRKVIGWKSGCGGLMGKGWHSWYKLKERDGFQNFANANKCVVPHSKLPEVFSK